MGDVYGGDVQFDALAALPSGKQTPVPIGYCTYYYNVSFHIRSEPDWTLCGRMACPCRESKPYS
jgi:hypothetical protein